MRRFFVEDISGDTASASPRESAHIVRVLRMEEGDEAVIFDGKNNPRKAVIKAANPDCVEFCITEIIENNNEPPINITIYQAVLKNDKFDYVVQKCVELGACAIQPFISENCVKKPKNPEAFISRAERIALEAAKQCGRYIIPEVLPIINIEEIPNSLNEYRPCFLLYEREKTVTLKAAVRILKESRKAIKDIAVIAGPEGGFAEREAILFNENGIMPVSVGKRILRAETAAPAACAMLIYEFEL